MRLILYITIIIEPRLSYQRTLSAYTRRYQLPYKTLKIAIPLIGTLTPTTSIGAITNTTQIYILYPFESFLQRSRLELRQKISKNAQSKKISQYDINTLSNRLIDINTNQILFVRKYIQQQPTIYDYPGRDYQKEQITANPIELRIDLQLIGQRDLLISEQRLLYNTVIYYFEDVLIGRNPL